MKKILIILCAVFICGVSIAQTIRWHIGDTVYQTTTCNAGESITPPTAPDKFGYLFEKWDVYAPINYLESTGSQWINTGYKPNQNIKILTLVTPKSVNETGIAGVQWEQRNPFLMFYNSKVRWHLTGSGDMDSNPIENNTPIYIEASNGVLKVNSLKYTSSSISSYSTNGSLKIFFSRGGGSPIKIHYFKIFDNDILVRDFIPVLDKNGIPCIFDRVESKFYYNAGTGDFIAGPVIGE